MCDLLNHHYASLATFQPTSLRRCFWLWWFMTIVFFRRTLCSQCHTDLASSKPSVTGYKVCMNYESWIIKTDTAKNSIQSIRLNFIRLLLTPTTIRTLPSKMGVANGNDIYLNSQWKVDLARVRFARCEFFFFKNCQISVQKLFKIFCPARYTRGWYFHPSKLFF